MLGVVLVLLRKQRSGIVVVAEERVTGSAARRDRVEDRLFVMVISENGLFVAGINRVGSYCRDE